MVSGDLTTIFVEAGSEFLTWRQWSTILCREKELLKDCYCRGNIFSHEAERLVTKWIVYIMPLKSIHILIRLTLSKRRLSICVLLSAFDMNPFQSFGSLSLWTSYMTEWCRIAPLSFKAFDWGGYIGVCYEFHMVMLWQHTKKYLLQGLQR